MPTLQLVALALTGFVALLHVYFFVLESVLWRTAYGRRVFKMSQEKADLTASLAANQGLYNLFLAAGLVWSILERDKSGGFPLQVFFLSCVVVAGVVGALTASRVILFAQALPGALALGATFAMRYAG